MRPYYWEGSRVDEALYRLRLVDHSEHHPLVAAVLAFEDATLSQGYVNYHRRATVSVLSSRHPAPHPQEAGSS